MLDRFPAPLSGNSQLDARSQAKWLKSYFGQRIAPDTQIVTFYAFISEFTSIYHLPRRELEGGIRTNPRPNFSYKPNILCEACAKYLERRKAGETERRYISFLELYDPNEGPFMLFCVEFLCLNGTRPQFSY